MQRVQWKNVNRAANRANINTCSDIKVQIWEAYRLHGGQLVPFNPANGRIEAARLDDFNPIHEDVPADTVFLVEAVELGLYVFILLPDSSTLFRYVTFLHSVAID